MADEIHERTLRARDDLLERLEHERVDEHVVHGREVRAERHVVNVVVRLRSAERRIDEFAVVARERDAPRGELALQRVELVIRELVAKPARTAVREERHAAIAQAEHLGSAARTVVVRDLHDLALAKVVAAPVGAELADLVLEAGEPARRDEEVQARGEVVLLMVVAEVKGVFTVPRPRGRDAEGLAHAGGSALDHHAAAEFGVHVAALLHGTLAAARAGGRALDDGVDERAADGFVHHGVCRQVELEQAHGALDVHAHGAGIHVRRRHEHAPNGRAVAGVRVRVEHEVGHARRAARVERLLQAARIEGIADGRRADDGDGLALVAARREEAGGFARGLDLDRHGVAHVLL